MEEMIDGKKYKILLSISNDLARIRGKEDMLFIINNTLRCYLPFRDGFILRYNESSRTCKPYVFQAESDNIKSEDFASCLSLAYPILDDSVEGALYPVVYSVTSLQNSGGPAIELMASVGITEFVVTKLLDGGQLLGFFVLLSEKEDAFSQEDLDLLNNLSYQLSIATANIIANEEIMKTVEENAILLSLSNEIAALRNRSDLIYVVNSRLKQLFQVTEFGIAQIDSDGNTYSAFALDLNTHTKNQPGYEEITSGHYAVCDCVFSQISQHEQPLLLDVNKLVELDEAPAYVFFWKRAGIKQVLCIALRTGGMIIGCLFLHTEAGQPVNLNANLLNGVCAQLSVAISNILANEEITSREKERSLLLSLSSDISTVRNSTELLGVIDHKIRKLLSFSHMLIAIINPDKITASIFLLDPGLADSLKRLSAERKNVSFVINDGIINKVLLSPKTIAFDLEQLLVRGDLPLYLSIAADSKIRQFAIARLTKGGELFGFWMVYFNHSILKDINKINLIEGIANQLSIAISNIVANEQITRQLAEINSYKQQLEEEKIYLKEEIEITQNSATIIGTGPEIQKIFKLIGQVAPSSSSVLLLGETGTGKELVARAIHSSSPRKDQLMVKVNCAAFPSNLIESELFGHEKGSFTGAIEKRIGKFELANKGTLFLDEIGEMPLDLQVKLLRAIQEKEIERVGGTATIKVDVRIIAATNRDLEKMLDEGKFRSDLYYRLNIFPIQLPPLRDRREDISQLVSHFIMRYAKNTGKRILGCSSSVLHQLEDYEWPGNIRELEHLIERSVLLARTDIIKEIDLPDVQKKSVRNLGKSDLMIKTIDEHEKEYIVQVLHFCKGKIAGPGGAAALLGVPPSTLNSKIKRLGIKREFLL